MAWNPLLHVHASPYAMWERHPFQQPDPVLVEWLEEKVKDLVDCVNLVDVSVVPEYNDDEMWVLCSKAVSKGKKFYDDACENPALLNDLLEEPLTLHIPRKRVVRIAPPPSIKNKLRTFFGDITNVCTNINKNHLA